MLAGFSALQLAVQLFSFAAGIQILRALSKEAYAKYTIAGTAIAFVGVLSDLGISQAMLAVGGQFASQPLRLQGIIRTGLRYRRIMQSFAAVALLIGLPYVFRQRKWPSREVWLVALICIAIDWFQAGYSIRSALLRVQKQFILCQSIEAGSALFRCLLIAAVAQSYLTVETALLANLFAICAQYGVMYTKTPLPQRRLKSDPATPDDASHLWRFCRPLVLPTIFFAFQGQITIWLLAIFGNSQYLANIGALSRLGQALVLFNVCISSIAVPYFASLEDRNTIILRFFVYTVLIAAIFATLVVSGALFPQLWLMVLGSRYGDLRYELLLMLTSAGEAFLIGAFYAISIARRRTRLQWLSVPLSLVGLGVALLISRPTSTRGAILIDIVRQIPLLALQITLACFAVLKHDTPILRAATEHETLAVLPGSP